MVFLRFLIVIIGFVLVTIPMLFFMLIAKILRLKFADKIPQFYHAVLLKILGVRVTICGTLKQNVPLVVISNHVSWLDILVIGSSFPCYFVAKSEIAGWPIFGFLAKMQNTIFVNRAAKGAKVGEQVNHISNALKNNKTIVLFPEGTTSDGNRLLKFKSALFAAAKATDTYQPYVQSIYLNYHKTNGLPMTRRHRPFVAWYGDADLVPHLKAMLSFTPIDVTLHIGDRFLYDDFKSRQEMAEYLENTMRLGYTKIN
jgi:lyso-ornithine lipid O-acyltransferase